MSRKQFFPLAALLTACASPDAAPPAKQATATPAPPASSALATTAPDLPAKQSATVRIVHKGGDAWTVEYTLAKPVLALSFAHARLGHTSWNVREPSSGVMRELAVTAPTPFTHVVLDLTTDLHQPEKEYRAFYHFSDGGQLLYTGQFGLEDEPDHDMNAKVTLVAAPGERVVAFGHSPAKEATAPLTVQGTYAYFGNIVPTETPSIIGVVDPGVPGWIGKRMLEEIPRVFGLYSDRLGALEGEKPTVFLTFAKAEGSHMSLGGNVLPRLINLDIELPEAMLEKPNAAILQHLDHLVAHEGAHVWNADRRTPVRAMGNDWLHEGAADALSARALRAVGAIDDTAYTKMESEAVSECALWLSDGKPLTASSAHARSQSSYACGETIGLLTEAAIRHHDPKADLFTFFRALFDATSGPYDEALYGRTLDALSGETETSALIRHLTHDSVNDPGQALADAFRQLGVDVKAVKGELPSVYEEMSSTPEALALLTDGCTVALEFDGNQGVEPRVVSDGACGDLKVGDKIAKMAGMSLRKQGASSYRAAYKACKAKHAVEIETAKGAHTLLPCTSAPKEPAAYFMLGRLP